TIGGHGDAPLRQAGRAAGRLRDRRGRDRQCRARPRPRLDRTSSLYGGMAVVIGSNLRKELAGGLLFAGVTFKVERRPRLALSGPNGAGKTTLLRMLAGETGVDGGQLVLDKGTRVALHDQRPPLDLGLSLREYALAGARDLVELEEELRPLAPAMAGSDAREREESA